MDSSRLKLFVDARMITSTGIGRHLVSHLDYLAKSGIELIVGVRDSVGAANVRRIAPLAEIRDFHSDIYSYKEHWRGSMLARSLRARASLFWYPHYNAPWWTPSPTVVTVHDLIHIQLPMLGWNKVRAQAARQVLRRAVGKAMRVICVSSATASDLMKFEPRISDRIRVIPNGLTDYWGPVSEEEIGQFRERQNLRSFLLLVGNKKSHKNQTFAFRVVDALAADFPELQLVIIGKREPTWRAAVSLWKEGGGRVDRLVDLEQVSDEQLRLYYNSASALLMPSLYEGFGYPPLEAMACGTPVISSNRGALPETVGDAAIVLDALDLASWIDATRNLLIDAQLRKTLIGRGFARVETFHQSKSGERLRCLLEDVCEEHSSRVALQA